MSGRIEKVNQSLRKEIGLIIQFEVKDPRVEFVTITAVEVSRDLQHAKVFFSVLGEQERVRQAQEGLERASGFIRKLVGERIRLRYMPEISFIFDRSIEYGFRIEKALEDIKKEERQRHNRRSTSPLQ